MAEATAFYLTSALLLTAALWVVISRQPMISVLALLVAMFCVAVLFILLEAYIVAALQILLYAGAVLVLFVFVIMLLNLKRDEPARVRSVILQGLGTVTAGLLFVQLAWLLLASPPPPAPYPPAPAATVRELGRLLFTTYLIPFELTSFLILAAIIGAVTLARGDTHRD